MVDRSLVERKFEASQTLAKRLLAPHAPLLAAYWEWAQERDRWIVYLVPNSSDDERKLVDATSAIMIEQPFRSVFSLSDVFVDAHQITRARAIGAYIRSAEDIGRQFDTTFTGGHYFESVIVIYIAPKLRKAHYAA
ncbi:MAG TPA: hypothetical protein VHX43_19235 [Xanthobacteraceae bacterium]|jgi:hypothetical protein|nr:hypothetical protein [Xanthobacteraceae bacterium]